MIGLLIENNVVVNTAIFKDDHMFSDGWVASPSTEIGIGFTLVDGDYVAPPMIPDVIEEDIEV